MKVEIKEYENGLAYIFNKKEFMIDAIGSVGYFMKDVMLIEEKELMKLDNAMGWSYLMGKIKNDYQFVMDGHVFRLELLITSRIANYVANHSKLLKKKLIGKGLTSDVNLMGDTFVLRIFEGDIAPYELVKDNSRIIFLVNMGILVLSQPRVMEWLQALFQDVYDKNGWTVYQALMDGVFRQ